MSKFQWSEDLNRAAEAPATSVTRRGMLGGMVGAATGAVLMGALPGFSRPAQAQGNGWRAPDDGTYTEPEIRVSRFGRLNTTITVTKGAATLGGQSLPGAMRIDGKVPGPTLVLRPGDTLKLKLVNQTDEMTNLHFHGLHVSPSGNSDNVFLMADAGETLQYELRIPFDHPGGLYWYHPHFHGLAHYQLDRGMAGMILIEAWHNQIPSIQAMRKRVMVFSHVQLNKDGVIDPTGLVGVPNSTVVKDLYLINGLQQPTMKIRPGEAQYWQMANVSATEWYEVALDGHSMWIVAEDGNHYPTPKKVDSVLLAMAKRFEVIVVGGATGSYTLRTLGHKVDLSFSDPAEVLGTLIVEGRQVPTIPIPQQLPPFKDLRNETVAHKRTIEFKEMFPGGSGAYVDDSNGPPTGGGPGGGGTGGPPPVGGGFNSTEMDFNFYLDGVQYDPNIVNTTVKVNTVEEWTLNNISDDDHPFHIHTNPFQITHRNGVPVDADSYNDVVRIPRGHSVTFRIKFSDYTGRTVYHCHNLFHEDRGMMAVIDIVS